MSKTKPRRKSVAIGAKWEKMLENAALRSGYDVTSIPDGCLVVGPNKIIRTPSPYDMIIFSSTHKVSIHLDAKAINQKTFPYSAINPKQMVELGKAARAGNYAGYLVLFIPLDQVVWFSTVAFSTAHRDEQKRKRSLAPEIGILLGSELKFDLSLIWKSALSSAG